jgi:hypothetical protein
MKKIVIAALVATSFTPVAFVAPAFANEVGYTGDECTLNANQIRQGFYCTIEVESNPVSRIQNNGKCKDGVENTEIVRHYNHRDNLQDEKTKTVVDETSWGGGAPYDGPCNNPLVD